MPLPLSLEIVGTDRSHPEAGSRGVLRIACRSVANDFPNLGRLFSHLPSGSHAVPGNVLRVISYCSLPKQDSCASLWICASISG